jgi:cell division septum initiation protein DivIVA
MSNEALAQARRLHLHALHGGSVTTLDLARLVQAMEQMQAERAQLREALMAVTRHVEAAAWREGLDPPLEAENARAALEETGHD